MITRLVRIQLVAFVLLSAVAAVYLGGTYIRLDRMLGHGVYTVRLQLAESGGIFSNAEVSYRGVTVGRVGDLRLIPDGVEADLVLDDSGPPIPAELHARVANRSAVGEQYVDLVPDTDGGPYLHGGSVIGRQRSATPLPVDTVLLNLDRLVASVPAEKLSTVVDELYAATEGTGPALQRLLDGTARLTATAEEHLPQTLALLRDGRTVLATVNDQAGAIESFSRGLRLLSEQLAASDADLRRLLAAGPAVSAELSALIRDAGPGLGDLIADLLVINTEVLLPRQENLRVPLYAYPIVAAGGHTVVPGDGTAHLVLSLNTFDPPPCRDGYQATPKREGTDTSPVPLNIAVNCAEPLGSPVDVRGVKHGYPLVGGQPNLAVPPWLCVKYGNALPGYTGLCAGDPAGSPPGGAGSLPGGAGSLPGGAGVLPGGAGVLPGLPGAPALPARPGEAGLPTQPAPPGLPTPPAALPGLLGLPDGAGAIDLLGSLLGGPR